MQLFYDRIVSALENNDVVTVSIDNPGVHLELCGLIYDWFETDDEIRFCVEEAMIAVKKNGVKWEKVEDCLFVCRDYGMTILIGDE